MHTCTLTIFRIHFMFPVVSHVREACMSTETFRSAQHGVCQVWSGSSDGSIAATDLDHAGKLDVATARSIKMPTGKGACAHMRSETAYACADTLSWSCIEPKQYQCGPVSMLKISACP